MVVDDAYEEHALSLTPIHRSLLGSSTCSVRSAAIAHPEHLNTCDDLGWTPLHLAVVIGDNEAVETLLDSGCEMEKRALFGGQTALFLAAYKNHLPIARALIERGANAAIICSGLTPVQLVRYLSPEKHGADIDRRDKWGRSVLSIALVNRQDNYFIAEALATAGAKFGTVDSEGRSLLSWIAEMNCPRWIYYLDATYWLGTDPDSKSNAGYTALDVLESQCAYNLTFPDPRKVRGVIGLAELIVEIREMNWNDGLFLDVKHRLSEDGSHRKLKGWIRLFQEDVYHHPAFADKEWDWDMMIWYNKVELEDGLADDDDALDIHSLTLRKPRDYDDDDGGGGDEGPQEASDAEDEFFDAPEP